MGVGKNSGQNTGIQQNTLPHKPLSTTWFSPEKLKSRRRSGGKKDT
jgi:hypothetical protein